MIKVFQQLVHKEKGDCMQCVVASLLDLPYDDVPRFIEHPNGWFEPFYALITKLGYKYKGMLHNAQGDNVYEDSHVKMLHKYNGVNGFFYAAVYSPKYFDPAIPEKQNTTHAVIIDKDYNIVHDPNPGNADVKKYPLADQMGYNGIIHVTLIESA